jgi:alkanesulfonate monooxygenase SsuD/methylene tetrahydromethanopterin reductase-like flavin-dependent oxidoreductase (luciferase family)
MTAPLADGSISLRLYPHDLPPTELVAEVGAQAALAERVGFDGVMLSEHHGGFPNYLPNPLLASTWALEATETIWAAACPQLLALRPLTQVVEDIAWTAARFPGRVGAGFAAGALPLDFEMAGVPFEEMNARFIDALPRVAAALRGEAESPLAEDAAVAALRSAPVPVVSAAQSLTAARRAAAARIGLLFDSIISLERATEVAAAHRAAGGEGARIMLRRVWIGDPPQTAVATQMDRFRAAAPDRAKQHWAPDGGLVAGRDPLEVAQRLDDQIRSTGCTAINLRVFHAGVTPDAVRDQIERIGTEVLPRLRAAAPGWSR